MAERLNCIMTFEIIFRVEGTFASLCLLFNPPVEFFIACIMNCSSDHGKSFSSSKIEHHIHRYVPIRDIYTRTYRSWSTQGKTEVAFSSGCYDRTIPLCRWLCKWGIISFFSSTYMLMPEQVDIRRTRAIHSTYQS